jgi:DNA invertase Pin-like site-specific DNA recombinase
LIAIDLSPPDWSILCEKFPVRFGRCRTRESADKKSRFSEQQIAFILTQAEDGTTVEEVCRKASISIQTYYRWRSKYGG